MATFLPLWGRTKEGGRAASVVKEAAPKANLLDLARPPHLPAPQEGRVRKLASDLIQVQTPLSASVAGSLERHHLPHPDPLAQPVETFGKPGCGKFARAVF